MMINLEAVLYYTERFFYYSVIDKKQDGQNNRNV